MLEVGTQAAEIAADAGESEAEAKTDLRKKENAQLLEEAASSCSAAATKFTRRSTRQVYDAMHKIGTNPENSRRTAKEKGMEQTAPIMIDHKTGAILGMIEGRDFYTEQMNHATQMTRQPGSTMKPIAAYLPAIEKGLIQTGQRHRRFADRPEGRPEGLPYSDERQQANSMAS